MADQHGFGNDGAKPTRRCKSKYRDDHMKQKDENVAHAGIVKHSGGLFGEERGRTSFETLRNQLI